MKAPCPDLKRPWFGTGFSLFILVGRSAAARKLALHCDNSRQKQQQRQQTEIKAKCDTALENSLSSFIPTFVQYGFPLNINNWVPLLVITYHSVLMEYRKTSLIEPSVHIRCPRARLRARSPSAQKQIFVLPEHILLLEWPRQQQVLCKHNRSILWLIKPTHWKYKAIWMPDTFFFPQSHFLLFLVDFLYSYERFYYFNSTNYGMTIVPYSAVAEIIIKMQSVGGDAERKKDEGKKRQRPFTHTILRSTKNR